MFGGKWSSGKEVSVVVASHRGTGASPGYAELFHSLPQSGVTYELIVIDNTRGDDTFAAHYQSITNKWVRCGINIGSGRGWNVGFQLVESPYVVVVNDDLILGEGSLGVLLNFLEGEEKAAIAGPVGEMWQVDNVHPHKTERFYDGGPRKVDLVGGVLFMARTKAIWNAGGIDPEFYPTGAEEAALCFKLRTMGWECWQIPGVGYTHDWHFSAQPRSFVLEAFGKRFTAGEMADRHVRLITEKFLGKV